MGLTQCYNANDPNDPNDPFGPSSHGTSDFVQDAGVYPYQITFENKSTATAPAKVVTIVQQLSAHLDRNTFQMGTITSGSNTVAFPAGLTSYSTTVDVSATLDVSIVVTLDVSTGL